MNLDIYRRQARNLAWYDQDGEPSSHNPFKKFRRTPRRTNSVQLEEQRGHSHSMNDLRLSEGTERRRNFTRDIGGPEHSDTFPPESAGSDGQHTNGPDPSMQSEAPINIPRELPFDVDGNGRPVDGENGKPRNRKEKGFLGRFKSSTPSEGTGTQEPDENKSAEKPKFTVASQLRATIFNSWINVLIIAAPVGSMFSFFLSCVARANCCSCAVCGSFESHRYLRRQLHRYHVSYLREVAQNHTDLRSPLAAMLSYATEEIAMRYVIPRLLSPQTLTSTAPAKQSAAS